MWLVDELLGIARNDQFHASDNDQLGRPEALSNGSGGVVWQAKNDAFDRTVLGTTIGAMNLGFPGSTSTMSRGFGTTGIGFTMRGLGGIRSQIPSG